MRVLKSARVEGSPTPRLVPAHGYWRVLAKMRWEFDVARGEALGFDTGPVTKEGPDTLVLWDRTGREVLTRYAIRSSASQRGHTLNAERKAYELLTEL